MTEPEVNEKRRKEDKICTLMIQIYCGGAHKNRPALKSEENLCPECSALADYVHQRVAGCPFMESKTFCSMCKVHCYKPEMREKIRKVMRYAGPRMLKYHPIMALRHVCLTVRQKSQLRLKKLKKSAEAKLKANGDF